ncbi:homocysteine S-methyltransferase family protein [Vibrio chagasii]|nr:homocysteine S-methyltransferase family protein [Vibrio chagasii]
MVFLIVGGCCGTTPEHIRQMAEAVEGVTPRRCRISVVSFIRFL